MRNCGPNSFLHVYPREHLAASSTSKEVHIWEGGADSLRPVPSLRDALNVNTSNSLGLQLRLICKWSISLSETVEKRVKIRDKEFEPLDIGG